MRTPSRLGWLLAALAPLAHTAPQEEITTPKEEFGFEIGADYHLASYSQLAAYWRKLESESDRMQLRVIGRSEEGREVLMAVVTSARNQEKLEHYRDIARRLALAEDLDEAEARALAEEGKAVIWIDGGLHASEVLVAQQLIETLYQMVARRDAETARILDDVIVLLCNPNPDGQELVAKWYMREKVPEKRSYRYLPRLYQKYIGHDNNRDFYMLSQSESRAVSNVLYRRWFPQIVFNHHQSGPAGTVLFAPPFRDPFNYVFDPLIPVGIDSVAAAMHTRFLVEGKRGATMRGGASYSTWWNGGLRSTAYYHNMIGLLTETIGSPNPTRIPLRLARQLASGDLPAPIAPQQWHFRQSVEYSLTSNLAVLDYASRHREQLLFNIYRMGRNSIERGSRDHWTIRPDRIAAAEEKLKAAPTTTPTAAGAEAGSQAPPAPERRAGERRAEQVYREVLHDPAQRDPRGYILPADQPDFLTATKFVNALIQSGIRVERAREPFTVEGRSYPAGSYIIRCAQAFRPHILSMFEPQVYPDDRAYPGGPPRPPYDSAGWTLAYLMGVRFERVLEGFEGPFERIEDHAAPPPAPLPAGEEKGGYLLSHRINDSFLAVNRLLAAGAQVEWLNAPAEVAHRSLPAGAFYVPRSPESSAVLATLARDLGLRTRALHARPGGELLPLRAVRIGLWDRYGGSMSSGWIRWILERFEFDFTLVYPPQLERGDLRSRFDVLIFPDGAIPSPPSGARARSGRGRRRRAPRPQEIPARYRERLGRFSAEKTLPALRAFLEKGGTIAAIGSSSALARHLEFPLEDALIEKDDKGIPQRLPRERFYIPGSVLEMRLDTSHPLACGMDQHTMIFFRRSPVFRLPPGALLRGLRPIAWFDSDHPLRSGWACGQYHLEDGITALEAALGRGRLYLFGPPITFRAQTHAAFKLLFNAILYGPARAAAAADRNPPRRDLDPQRQ